MPIASCCFAINWRLKNKFSFIRDRRVRPPVLVIFDKRLNLKCKKIAVRKQPAALEEKGEKL